MKRHEPLAPEDRWGLVLLFLIAAVLTLAAARGCIPHTLGAA